MKISYMLKREKFYEINKNTLENFYQDSSDVKRLYIYPELNAIVTAWPSRTVREYLYTEFRVNGSALKRLLVRLYAMVMLNSGGLLAAKTMRIKSSVDRDTLIYPCNKKYRIFEFAQNKVSVFSKVGFPKTGLENEIMFRTQNNADFIPELLVSDDYGYTEMIIDGYPVARAGVRTKELSERAFDMWSDYILPHTQKITATEYAQSLYGKIEHLKKQIQDMGKSVDVHKLDMLSGALLKILQTDAGVVPVSLSHGDLQPGNIWVENGTDRIYIIDWESWEKRSIWYDEATLFQGLRRSDGIMQYAKCRDLVHATVLLEDLIFRLTDLTNLPHDYGCQNFDDYVSVLQGESENV